MRRSARHFSVKRQRELLLAQHFTVFLLLAYTVLPGVASVIFKTFPCYNADPDGSASTSQLYMRADYSISCSSQRYQFAVVWAAVMVFVYPVGIPLLYFVLLYQVRARHSPQC